MTTTDTDTAPTVNQPSIGRDPVDEQLALTLGTLGRAAQVHDRPDLVAAAHDAHGRLRSTVFRVVVMGEFKKGKTSLVNNLVNATIGVVDDDLATASPTEVGFADPPRARCWSTGPDGEGHDGPITLDQVGPAGLDASVSRVRVGLPRPLLQTGLVLVDTPGVGGIGSAAAVATAAMLAEAHAVIFVTDCAQELTAAELGALVDATRRCPTVVLVETKTDLYPAWRRIVEADRDQLSERGLDLPVLAVSNHLRHLALVRGDRDLNTESGFPALVELIGNTFVASARDLIRVDAAAAARRIHSHLRRPLAAELEALLEDEGAGPDGSAQALVEAARRELAELRERSAGWAQILNDGMVDLASEIDLDLRDALRGVITEVESTIEDVDPDQVWGELEPTVQRQVAEAIDTNLGLLRDGVDRLAARLAEVIHDETPALVSVLAGGEGDQALIGPTGLTRVVPTARGVGARAQAAFRSGYGGAMPIMVVGGMVFGVLGLGTLVMPLAGVAGAAAGRRALKDERERALVQRRQQAKVAVKQYVDETGFRAGAHNKATVRRVQRELRDHFTARVKEIVVTHQQVLQRAEAMAEATSEQRRQRVLDLQGEITRLDAIAQASGPEGGER